MVYRIKGRLQINIGNPWGSVKFFPCLDYVAECWYPINRSEATLLVTSNQEKLVLDTVQQHQGEHLYRYRPYGDACVIFAFFPAAFSFVEWAPSWNLITRAAEMDHLCREATVYRQPSRNLISRIHGWLGSTSPCLSATFRPVSEQCLVASQTSKLDAGTVDGSCMTTSLKCCGLVPDNRAPN